MLKILLRTACFNRLVRQPVCVCVCVCVCVLQAVGP